MVKQELVKKVAAASGMEQKAVANVLELTLGTISNEVAMGGNVTLKNFGTFKKVHKNARRYRTPSTGEYVDIPACDKVKFCPHKGFDIYGERI